MHLPHRALFPFALLGLVVLPPLILADPQERVQAKKPADVPTLIQEAQTAWTEQRFGGCLGKLHTAVGIVAVERNKVIRRALPPAPPGYKLGEHEGEDEAATNMLGLVGMGMWNVVTQDYQREDGGQSISVTVTADSPLIQMFGMWIQNPALLPPGSEVVKYGAHSGILKKENEGQSRNLQILIGGKTLCEVNFPGEDEKALFKMFDQAAVDRLAAAIAR